MRSDAHDLASGRAAPARGDARHPAVLDRPDPLRIEVSRRARRGLMFGVLGLDLSLAADPAGSFVHGSHRVAALVMSVPITIMHSSLRLLSPMKRISADNLSWGSCHTCYQVTPKVLGRQQRRDTSQVRPTGRQAIRESARRRPENQPQGSDSTDHDQDDDTKAISSRGARPPEAPQPPAHHRSGLRGAMRGRSVRSAARSLLSPRPPTGPSWGYPTATGKTPVRFLAPSGGGPLAPSPKLGGAAPQSRATRAIAFLQERSSRRVRSRRALRRRITRDRSLHFGDEQVSRHWRTRARIRSPSARARRPLCVGTAL